MKNKKKKIVKTLTILGVIAALVIGAVLWIRHTGNELKKALETATQESAVIQRRDLVSVVAATGKIESLESAELTPAVSGVKINKIYASVGDYVHKGDVIAELDDSTIKDNLEIANNNLSNAQKSANLNINSANRRVSEAEANRDASRLDMDKRISEAEENLAKYKDLRDQAENLYNKAVESRKEIEQNYGPVAGAYSNLETVRNQIESLKLQIDSAGEDGDYIKQAELTAALRILEASVPSLERARDDAEAKYGLLLTLSNALTAAQNAENAQLANYNSYITQVESLESSLESLKKSSEDTERANESTIASSKDSLQSAKLSANSGVEQTKLQISTYEEQIEACVVKAPFDGVVTLLPVKEGDTYAGRSIATIEDISRFVVNTEIDEYDIGKIKLGQKVAIKTNGTGDEILDGTVTKIAPRATNSMSGTVTYTVQVSVDTKNDALRLDMTAKLSIILEDADNVLSVPYDSVYTDEDDGRSYVEVIDGVTDDKWDTHRVYIEKGIATDYYVEVRSTELSEGMEITVSREASDVFDLSSFFRNRGATSGM
ncbi:MAG: HlyD family efflux transporter periplasmic adaptor subunit [Lachnospiraceae bacterium]|nr:HlyD family efflux transporter periplasmic adaptor subunit [Lachnospiraceae bacterium]